MRRILIPLLNTPYTNYANLIPRYQFSTAKNKKKMTEFSTREIILAMKTRARFSCDHNTGSTLGWDFVVCLGSGLLGH